VALVHAADAVPRSTVEDLPAAAQPPVYDANEVRDEFGNPRVP